MYAHKVIVVNAVQTLQMYLDSTTSGVQIMWATSDVIASGRRPDFAG